MESASIGQGEVYDIRDARKEIAALRHDLERMYQSLCAEANARMALEVELARLKVPVKAIERYGL